MSRYTFDLARDIDCHTAVALGIAEIDGSVWRFKIPYKDSGAIIGPGDTDITSGDIPIAETRRQMVLDIPETTANDIINSGRIQMDLSNTIDNDSTWEQAYITQIKDLRAALAALTVRVGNLEKAPRVP